MQKSIALSPTKTASSSHLLKSPSSFLNISYRVTVWQDYRIEGKIALPMTSFKPSWAISLSLFCVLKKFSIKCVKCRSDVTKWLSLGCSWPSVSTCGSKIVGFKLQKHFDTHWPGEDDYRPASFFQTVWLNQKCWYLKNVQKDVECRRRAKGWLSGSVGL